MALRIVLIGPAPAGATSRGGMATVMSAMLNHPDPQFSIRVVDTYRDTGTARRLVAGVAGMVRATLLILAGRADLVHVHLSHGGSVLRKALPLWAARLRGVPAVIHAHSYNFGEWFAALPSPVQRLVPTLLPAQRILVLGSALRHDYRVLGEHLTVLHNPAPECSPIAPESVRAVSFGRIGERKGSFDVLRAVDRLPSGAAKRLDLMLAGDGEVEKARQWAKTMTHAKDAVRVEGWISPAERDALLSDAGIFLLPSYDEGLPMALLEAMAAGVVPIVTLVGAIGDVVVDGENALVVEPGDVEGIARALTQLMDDAALRHRLAEGAQRTAADLSLHNWHNELAQLWTELADAP